MMDPLRVAFIGCGRFSGRAIYPSLAASGMELVAVCGRTRERTETRAAESGVEQVFYDPVEMCTAVKRDAVLIVAGPQGHYDIASALIPLGLPIWMEKPCAVNSEQASELSARAGAAGLLVQVGFNYRYTRGIQKALDCIVGFSADVILKIKRTIRHRLALDIHLILDGHRQTF